MELEKHAHPHEHENLWDEIDCLVDAAVKGEPEALRFETLVLLMKEAIELTPEGAARRARSLRPQYDLDRIAAEYGGEHERTPDGGGDQPQPHPEQFALANDCS